MRDPLPATLHRRAACRVFLRLSGSNDDPRAICRKKMGSACWQFFQNLRMLLDGCADGCACGLAVQEAKQAKRQVQQTRWPNAMALGRGSRWLALGRARLLLLAPRGSSTRLEPAEPRWKLAKRRKLAYSALHAHGEPVQNRKAFRAHVLHSRPPAAERKHESHAAVVWRCNSPLLQQRHQQRTALFLCVRVHAIMLRSGANKGRDSGRSGGT
jgi:hypothetical protein